MSVKQGGKSGGFKTPQPEANLKKRKKERKKSQGREPLSPNWNLGNRLQGTDETTGISNCFSCLILATQTRGQVRVSSTGATSVNATSKLLKVEFPGDETTMLHIAKQLYSLDWQGIKTK